MEKYIKPNDYYLNKINFMKSSNYMCNKDYQDEYTNVSKIYAIGDIHGDCSILIKMLKNLGLINKSLEWCGKDAHVVQLGDLLDGYIRHDMISSADRDTIMALEEFTILELLNDLDFQARKVGGRVHYLIGNHELMNVLGDFSYVLTEHMTEIPRNIRKLLFQPGGYMAQMLACHSYSILKINDWIFCHGGLLPEHIEKLDKNKQINQINNTLRKVLLNEITLEQLSDDEKNIIIGSNGLFWTRHYKFDELKCDTLDDTLKIINNDKNKGGLILGHTPHSKITAECNKKLFFVDIGLSRAFPSSKYNKMEALLIEKNKKPRSLSFSD